MSKGVIIKTNNGTYLVGSIQCSNGCYLNADGCWKYCKEDGEWLCKHQANKLIGSSTLLSRDSVNDELWYKDRNNFIDVDINYECDQSYKEELIV